MNPPFVWYSSLCLQIPRGRFPAPKAPNWFIWPWWCTVGWCHRRCLLINFSPYILNCLTVECFGLSGPLLVVTWLRSLICSGNRHGIVSPSVCRSRFSTYTDDECGSVSLTTVSLIRTVPQRRETWDGLRSATLLGEWGHVVRQNWFCCSVCG